MRTTYGSPLFAEHVPTHDSLLVERLRPAGAVIIGKTNTPEFGAGSQTFNAVFGATRNPHDLTKTPGGSSGGAAAAVASGMLPFADGSDLGASVRNPAAFCGLVGLRPTPGRIPDHGPGRSVEPVRPSWADRPQRARRRAAASGARRPRPARPALDPGAVAVPPSSRLRPARPADRLEPRSRRPARRSRGHRRAGGAARELEALGCIVEDAEPDFSGADECFEVLRGVELRRRLRVDRRRPQADAARERPLRPARWKRTGSRKRSRCAASCSRACASSSPATTSSPAPTTQVAPFSVDTEYPTEIAGSRWAPTSSGSARAAGSRSPRIPRCPCRRASRPTGCRSGCSSSAATAASSRCSGSRTRSRGDRAPSAPQLDALAVHARHGRAPRRATATPSRARSGCATPREPTPALTEHTEADLCIVGGGFTGLWAALYAAEQGRDVVVLEAETAGFGASGRNGGFAWRRSRTGSRTASRASPRRCRRSSGSRSRTSTASSRRSRRVRRSTATSRPPASCSR